jgi:hypothetical protein
MILGDSISTVELRIAGAILLVHLRALIARSATGFLSQRLPWMTLA